MNICSRYGALLEAVFRELADLGDLIAAREPEPRIHDQRLFDAIGITQQLAEMAQSAAETYVPHGRLPVCVRAGADAVGEARTGVAVPVDSRVSWPAVITGLEAQFTTLATTDPSAVTGEWTLLGLGQFVQKLRQLARLLVVGAAASCVLPRNPASAVVGARLEAKFYRGVWPVVDLLVQRFVDDQWPTPAYEVVDAGYDLEAAIWTELESRSATVADANRRRLATERRQLARTLRAYERGLPAGTSGEAAVDSAAVNARITALMQALAAIEADG